MAQFCQSAIPVRAATCEDTQELAPEKKIKDGQKNSLIYQKAKDEKRLGGKGHKHTEATKQKIREKALIQFQTHNNKINITNHRTVMAECKGRRVIQYDLNGNILNEFVSMSEAARQNDISPSSVYMCASGRTKQSCGYVWKYKN